MVGRTIVVHSSTTLRAACGIITPTADQFTTVGTYPGLAANTGEAAVNPAWAEFVASGRYHHRGYTIAGGSSEVQHNIIAKQVLGL